MQVLARTGESGLFMMGGVALAIIALGVALFLIARRRRDSRSSAASLGAVALAVALVASGSTLAAAPPASAATHCVTAPQPTPAPTTPPETPDTPDMTPVDLTPTITSDPVDYTVDGSTGLFTVSVKNLGETASGPNAVVRVSKHAIVTDVALVESEGWTLDSTSSDEYYILTYAPGLPGAGSASVQLSYTMSYGTESGSLPVTATIPDGSANDSNSTNNTSNVTLTYTTVAPELVDLQPILSSDPTAFTVDGSTGTFTLTIENVTGVASGNDARVRINKTLFLSNFTLPPNPDWTLEVPDTGSFIFLTYGPSIPANGSVSVDFDYVINFGQSSGTFPVTAALLGGSAGDSNPANNISVVNLSYNGIPATPIDLRPILSSSPTEFPVDNTPGALTVSIENVGETDSNGNQIIRVGKNTAITNVALVPNSGWTLDATSSSGFYILTYAPSIPGLETVSAELTYVMSYGASSGSFPVTASIPVNSGGDTNVLNNGTSVTLNFGTPPV